MCCIKGKSGFILDEVNQRKKSNPIWKQHDNNTDENTHHLFLL